MELVKFKNGKYGIRKRNLFNKIFKNEGVFFDFRPQTCRWRKSDDKYFNDCQLDSVEETAKYFNNINFSVVEKVIL